MKGVILAGGTGSRLHPITKITNKHLLPVYDQAMIMYPIQTLKKAGIREIMIITGAEHAEDFMRMLGSGAEFGLQFTYRIQDKPLGIAQAVSLAESFATGESLAVILGDNIFEDTFREAVENFTSGAQVFYKSIQNPRRYGVIEVADDGKVVSIEEKPAIPKSSFAQTGLYLYDRNVFELIRSLTPSKRGELEVSELNQLYINQGTLVATQLHGFWIDAGTHDALLDASIAVQKTRRKTTDTQTPQKVSNKPHVTIGILTYNSAQYVQSCLETLTAQDYSDYNIVVLDNASTDQTVSLIHSHFPEIHCISSDKNNGFSAGHNEIIRQAKGEFYACVNIDMIFERSFISNLVAEAKKNANAASIGGKIKRWDFKKYESTKSLQKSKTNFIDTVGLQIDQSHRVKDIAQGMVDSSVFGHATDRFGISGAAVLYRMEALKDVAYEAPSGTVQYFDEAMWMYKEDVDLAYRLQWAGWKARYTPQAIAFHDRTISGAKKGVFGVITSRKKRKKKLNALSYKNHLMMVRKNMQGVQFGPVVKRKTWMYNFGASLYLLIFETECLLQRLALWQERAAIADKASKINRRVSVKTIEDFMKIDNQ
jgi:glucose-1-phosphate thymidylyltransferase